MGYDSEDSYRYKSQLIVTKAPKRLVSLVPSMTETLFDLGFGDNVVGITDDCLYPEGKVNSKYRVGAVDALRVPDIVGLYPDLVIANREENRSSDLDLLEEAGLNVWKTFPRTVMEAMNLIWDVLHLFMVDDRMLYERVNLINRTVDWVGGVSEAKEGVVVCKVFAPILPIPLTTFAEDTYTHDLIRVSGGTNVFGNRVLQPMSSDPAQDMNRYPQVTLKDVEAAQPDIVLLPAYPYAFTDRDVARFKDLDTPAAKTNQIYLIDGTLLTYHGTRMARALNELSALMCEETDDGS